MSKFVSFVAGALTGAAAMVGLAFWISEQEGGTDSSPKTDLEAANEVSDQATQEQNDEGDFEETVPAT